MASSDSIYALDHLNTFFSPFICASSMLILILIPLSTPSQNTFSYLSLRGTRFKIHLKSIQRGKGRLKRWAWTRFWTSSLHLWLPSLSNKLTQDPGFWEVGVVISFLQSMLHRHLNLLQLQLILLRSSCHTHLSTTAAQMLPFTCHLSLHMQGHPQRCHILVAPWGEGRQLERNEAVDTEAAKAEGSF